jgi:hypothetical protein
MGIKALLGGWLDTWMDGDWNPLYVTAPLDHLCLVSVQEVRAHATIPRYAVISRLDTVSFSIFFTLTLTCPRIFVESIAAVDEWSSGK